MSGREQQVVQEVFASNPIAPLGAQVDAFEAEFAATVGAPYVLALASGTAALHLVLIQAGVGPGDEVITTPYTFAATAEVVRYFDARPVLVDVDSRDLNLDPARIEAAVTPRTRAIIPVHIAGLPAELDAIAAIAARHGLAVIEDAAHAFPTRYKGRLIGSPISAPAIHHPSPIIPHCVATAQPGSENGLDSARSAP